MPAGQAIEVTLADGSKARVNYPSEQAQFALQQKLEKAGAAFDSRGSGSLLLGLILVLLLPLLLIGGLFLLLMRRAQGGASGAFGFGKSRAKRVSPDALDPSAREAREVRGSRRSPPGGA